MATWDSYTQKSTPADADTLMIKDTSGGANKRTPFSGVWNWILTKLTNAVISQLETTNKSIIPAINELNSKTQRIQSVSAGSMSQSTYTTLRSACQHIVDNVLANTPGTFLFVYFSYGSDYLMIAQKYEWDDNYAAYLVFGYGSGELIYQNKIAGSWK